jgi:hypothetical protein
MRCQLFGIVLLVWAAYFPEKEAKGKKFTPPQLLPWDNLRATESSLLITWTAAINRYASVATYELYIRRPALPVTEQRWAEDLRNRHAPNPRWREETVWTEWEKIYTGPARAYRITEGLIAGHPYELQVRAHATNGEFTDFSEPQLVHTLRPAEIERFPFRIRGTGRNNPNYTEIEVDHRIIYRRWDQTGLVLAAFQRTDLQLVWLETYDTMHNVSRSRDMANDLRSFDQSFFLMVVSSDAWEMRATQTLVKAMEYCGAYHFGQWAYIFAEQQHYPSVWADLEQSASQQEFGHPYALVGIPGIGTGMGWESLHYNTGHYLATGHAHPSIIVGTFMYDYLVRHYRITDVIASKSPFYEKAMPPAPDTTDYPTPLDKVEVFMPSPNPAPAYVPYIGTLQRHMDAIMESNQTSPPRNYGFLLVTDARVYKVDPRPPERRLTELERVWGGPSARYWTRNIILDEPATLLFDDYKLPQVQLEDRSCVTYIFNDRLFAGNSDCPQCIACGQDHSACCEDIDKKDIPALTCGIGVVPILCDNSDNENLVSESGPADSPPATEPAHYHNGRINKNAPFDPVFNGTYPFRVLVIEEHEEAYNFTKLEMIRLRKETVESLQLS